MSLTSPLDTRTTTTAVVIERPSEIALRPLELPDLGEDELLVDVSWSGISTGTERLLFTGRMPPFPGLGYPLVPGYESVGCVRAAGANATHGVGTNVFVPGASCYGDVHGLFGGAASRMVVSDQRVHALPPEIDDERAVLLALAATARHALTTADALPELIIGHGVLGRLRRPPRGGARRRLSRWSGSEIRRAAHRFARRLPT